MDNETAPAPERKKSGWQWPAIVVFLLAIPVLSNVVLVLKATGDPSFVIEENYYQKSLQWDQVMAQEAENQRLAWNISVKVGTPDESGKVVPVLVHVNDASGAPVRGANVELTAFHNARAATILHANGTLDDAGTYQANLALRRQGLHEFQIAVRRDADVFTAKIQRDVTVGAR